jgi:N-formylmaleamate deformylase
MGQPLSPDLKMKVRKQQMAHWSEGDVIANGIRVHYQRTGGAKPALVIATGVTDMGIAWSRVARALEQDYDVIMYDKRGHGHSEKPATGYTFQDHAADLVALIAALGLRRPRVIGHSGGAAAATLAAADHPDLMACLILEDPCWGTGWGAWESLAVGMRAWFRSLGALTREELVAKYRAENPEWLDEEVTLLAETKLQVSPHVVQTFDQPEPPWREALARIACPILLITGDPAKGLFAPDDARETASLWRDGQVVQIDGAGHMIHYDRYELFVAAVKAFLAQVAAGEGIAS